MRRVLGNPGALLVDGEIAGTWRAKQAGRSALELAVSPFGTGSATKRRAVTVEAEHLASTRQAADVRITYE